jgi:hypothetical protein
VSAVRLDLQVLLVTQVTLVQLVLLVSQVTLVKLVLLVSLVTLVLLVTQDLLDQKDQKDLLVLTVKTAQHRLQVSLFSTLVDLRPAQLS